MTARDLIIQWLNKAINELHPDEEIYIPCEDKTSRTEAYQRYRKELDILRNISPEDAAKVRVSTTFKDKKYWVVLKRIAVVAPTVAYKKSRTGTVEKVSITTTFEVDRIKRLKMEDAAI